MKQNIFSKEELERLREVDVRTVDPETLVDIRDVHIDSSLGREERLRQFLEQIKNPYCYRCGKMVVKVNFAEDGESIGDRMKAYLESQQQQ